MTIADIRTDYRRASLSEQDVADDPIAQFTRWFDEAVKAAVVEPNAMCLATATPDAYPSARMVLLKGCDARGFVFYTATAAGRDRSWPTTRTHRSVFSGPSWSGRCASTARSNG